MSVEKLYLILFKRDIVLNLFTSASLVIYLLQLFHCSVVSMPSVLVQMHSTPLRLYGLYLPGNYFHLFSDYLHHKSSRY